MSDLFSAGRLHGRALAQERRRRQVQQKLRGQGKAGMRAPQPGAERLMAPAQAAPEGQVQATQGIKTDAHEAQPAADQAAVGAQPAGTTVEDAVFDAVCEIAETKPEAFGWRDQGVRKLCKARRRSLAQHGKVAIPVRNGLISAAARQNYLETGSVREFARRHRQELATHGRGSAQPARPTGRRRRPGAPVKVETDQTLAGSTVTGTQVHRAAAITGTESGSCRTITGTEYLGVEHYTRFCDTRPERGPAKVRVGRTTGNVGVSGTFLGPARTTTGDEAGACRAVTGTEYVDGDQFQAACDAPAPARPAKVAMGRTARRQLPVSGSDEARTNRVTGAEPGATAKITGSQYADGGAARITINGAPQKVALTHTIAGREVSGTAVGNSGRITGLNAGECRTLTGTEYLSHETFTSICRTEPQPSKPPKVEESYTDKRQRITGNLVDRSEKVTGNEPGSCRRLTGTGYNGPQMCGGGVDKVQIMTGLRGTGVTGTGMDKLPKTTGDEHGGCWPVTGTAYYGREHYAQCASTPPAGARKVTLTHTDTGHIVSGPALGASAAVTGNEAGAEIAVSGTPYIGREEVMVAGGHAPVMAPGAERPTPEDCAGGCGCKQRFEDIENRLRTLQRELAGRSVAPRAASHRFVSPALEPMTVAPEAQTAGFSVIAPAQQGRSRLTGNAGAGDDGRRITGPINLARGLVTGTPEFRGREALPSAMAITPVAVDGEGAPEAAPPVAGAWRVTGDDWSRNDRVTGTEGRSAQGRNPTQRGVARTCVMSAAGNRERPLAVPVPEGQVTGSSGHSLKGSIVTYSGGARG